MSSELLDGIFRSDVRTADAAVVPAQSGARLSFIDTDSVAADATVELSVADSAVSDEPGVRFWRRNGTTERDAQIILAWLNSNALTDGLGVDTDMLVQLFIEAAVNDSHGRYSCDGELLATLAGAAEPVGTTASSQWHLELNLTPEVVEATLAAIADSDPRWRYAIVAARDPESPAGRVRQRLLSDLDG